MVGDHKHADSKEERSDELIYDELDLIFGAEMDAISFRDWDGCFASDQPKDDYAQHSSKGLAQQVDGQMAGSLVDMGGHR